MELENTNKEYKIDTTSLYEKFKKHLDLERNDKVFFSGKFGTGKTTFLSDYFEKYADEYDVYHLFPINYQIKANEDIVDLLRYDLLVSLLQKHPESFVTREADGIQKNVILWWDFIRSHFTVNDALQKTVNYLEDGLEVCDSILQTKFSKLGRPLSDLLKLDKQFQEFKEEYKMGDYTKVESFLQSVESKEPDALSYLLSQKISEQKSTKKSVLILDDLDRIDPAHIFRILNIFSAFHELDDNNKFGFDKVIVVGDVVNIKHIFHHFYGKETDFWGYIDKFYSNSVYKFSYSEILSGEIKKLIHLLGTRNGEVLQGFQNDDYFIHGVLHHILYEASYVDERPNLRQLLKLNKFSSVIRSECNYREKSNLRSRHEEMLFAINFVIKVLLQIFRTSAELNSVLDKIKVSKQQDKISENFYLYYSKPMLFSVLDTPPREGYVAWSDYQVRTVVDQDGASWEDSSASKNARAMFFDLIVEMVDKKLYE